MKGATVAALDRRRAILDGLDRVALLVQFDFSRKQYEIPKEFSPMALIEITEDGRCFPLIALPYLDEFNVTWLRLSEHERDDIEAEINRRLDEMVNFPDPNWGTITNTSIEGGKPNTITGIRGDWGGTPLQRIYEVCGYHEEVAGMFYGNVWKRVIINRDETWYGIRPDPTFPQRGIELLGKTYFLPDRA